MPPRQTRPELRRSALPNLWLLSDQRNDPVLDAAIAALPERSGFVFRHYHLEPDARRARFEELAAACRGAGHLTILSDAPRPALDWGADGIYGPVARLGGPADLWRLAAVHDAEEIEHADRAGVDAMFLSPVYPTRSHPGGTALGKDGFLSLAAKASAPVIALGGMSAARAVDLGWPRWAAIDGLS